ncbi:hypothetical protein BDZ94DRAFT_1267019 [Collybia nuda]|uniref:Uncharacterized protein n=1 Tax=Collybia nuda TaxID=64659 RepID=A0A9P5Y255_9AGAR|nr:hypothetical protein BDZ94DRAFT_1267019 [Collybia nuda]
MPELRIRSRAIREKDAPDEPSGTTSDSQLYSKSTSPKSNGITSPQLVPTSQWRRIQTLYDQVDELLSFRCLMKVTVLIVIGALTTVTIRDGWFQQTLPIRGLAPSTMQATSMLTDSARDSPDVGQDQIAFEIDLPSRKVPVVYRSVLEKLEGNSARHRKNSASSQWPPLVTGIPEWSDLHNRLHPHVCDDLNQTPCRFLFPFRISDQEYKARSHIEQLAKLALDLNRTLVLPNVGKNRVGVCYKYSFEVYYDLRSLQESIGVSVMMMDAFKSWAGPQISITTQIITLSTQPWQNVTFPVFMDENIVVQVDNLRDAKRYKFPGCFSKRFPYLDVGNSFPNLIISPSISRDKPIGNSIVQAISGNNEVLERVVYADNQSFISRASKTSSQAQPDILLVNWELPYPIFQQSSDPGIHYSSDLVVLAQKIAPSDPYLAIYWSMESLPSNLLDLCVHTLVDMITNLLLDPTLSSGIKNVFFSSDYPYPLFQTAPYSHWATLGNVQVGNVTDITQRHAEAMGILREAFEKGGVLSQWSLTDFVGEISHINEENILLQDKGILGIVERTISSRAALFVTANSRTCGGASPLAKQIIDTRRQDRVGLDETMLRNLVDVFG